MGQTDWADLKLFLAFARGGTVRKAAASIGVGHSTVSRRLEQLERTAGVALFERGGRGMRLTEAGQEMRLAAERIEDEVFRLERQAYGLDRQMEGPVTLTTVDALAVDPFLQLMSEFCNRYPMIDFRLEASTAVANLDRREADLALRFGIAPDGHLVGRKLTPTTRAVYASKAYLREVGKDPLLREAVWISYSPNSASEGWKDATPYKSLPTRLRSYDMRTQLVACRNGFGLALLPCFLCDPEPDLIRVSEPEIVPRQTLWLLRHADARENPRVRALTDFLHTALPRLYPLLKGENAKTWDGRPL